MSDINRHLPATPLNWTTARRLVAAWFRDPTQFLRDNKQDMVKMTCPMCSYHGIFISVGRPTRWDACCPQCRSRERHRLIWLWAHENGGDKFANKRILHFAPEKVWLQKMRGNPQYETADLYQKGVMHTVDIHQVGLPDNGYDIIMCNHVLEHLDHDLSAMQELFRLLKQGGTAVLSVPINSSRNETYENNAVTEPGLRTKHFGAADHKRYYGLDFSARLESVGFSVDIYRLPPEMEAKYGLLRDEWIYIARKPVF